MACQDGSLVVLRPGGGRGGATIGGGLWDEVDERRWAEPADAPLSCMHVREGNTSLVAVASRRGIHVLTENEAGVNPVHFLAFARAAFCAGSAASIGHIFAQVLLSSACTVHYLDRGEPPATFVLSPPLNVDTAVRHARRACHLCCLCSCGRALRRGWTDVSPAANRCHVSVTGSWLCARYRVDGVVAVRLRRAHADARALPGPPPGLCTACPGTGCASRGAPRWRGGADANSVAARRARGGGCIGRGRWRRECGGEGLASDPGETGAARPASR